VTLEYFPATHHQETCWFVNQLIPVPICVVRGVRLQPDFAKVRLKADPTQRSGMRYGRQATPVRYDSCGCLVCPVRLFGSRLAVLRVLNDHCESDGTQLVRHIRHLHTVQP
jgi:hypothetical protein